MRRRRVGSSGLEVSRIGLGTMTWGDATDAEGAAEQLTAFVDAGGTLVETADGYGDGAAQEVLGEVLAGSVPREYLVIAARSVSGARIDTARSVSGARIDTARSVSGARMDTGRSVNGARMDTGRATLPGGALGDGAARGALLAGLDATLARIGTDHLDLWQLPGFDASVPLEETLSAVQVAVLAGKARYAGLVAPRGWQLATVAERARSLGSITVPVSAQVEYSLLTRDAEDDLLPAATHHGVGLLAWAPLGRGVLTGKYAEGTPADSRAASPALAAYVEARRNERSARIVQAVLTAADGLGTSPLAVALAWVRDGHGVSAAVVGARDSAQLAASMAAETVTLPAEIRAALDDVSGPG